MLNSVLWVVCASFVLTAAFVTQPFKPEIPRAWDDKEVEGFELPLAQRDRPPSFLRPFTKPQIQRSATTSSAPAVRGARWIGCATPERRA